MSIESARDLEGLRRVGRIVAAILTELKQVVRAGVSTTDIDAACAQLLARHGARSGPQLAYGFPGALCVSINDEAVHGVPSRRVIAAGDLVKLDLVAERDGYFADAAVSVVVPPASPVSRQLVKCARRAFGRALEVIRVGARLADVGRAIEREVRRAGFAVIPQLGGHGVGRAVHEPPAVPNFADAGATERLSEGLVIAVEPIICAGSGAIVEAADGWTIRTADGTLAAHYEHTLVVTRGRPLVLTS